MRSILLFLFVIPFSLIAQDSRELLQTADENFYDFAINFNDNSRQVADSLFQKLLIQNELSKEQFVAIKMKHTLLQGDMGNDRIPIFDSLSASPDVTQSTLAQIDFSKTLVEIKSKNEYDAERLINSYGVCKEQKAPLAFLSFALAEIALQFSNTNNLINTIAYTHKAKAALQSSAMNVSHHGLNQRMGQNYFRVDKLDSSAYYLEKSYHELKETSNPSSALLSQYSWNAGSTIQARLGNFHRARPYLLESLEHYIKAFGEEEAMVISRYVILSDNFFSEEDIQKASFYAQKADAIGKKVLTEKDVYLRTLIAFANSDVLMSKGEYELAEDIIGEVLEDNIESFGIGDRLTVSTLYNMATAQDLLGKYNEAEKNYLLAVKGAKQADKTISITSALDRLGTFYLTHNQYEKALEAAIAEKDTLNSRVVLDSKIKFRNRVRISEAYTGLGNFDKAEEEIDYLDTYINKFSNVDDLQIELLGLKLSHAYEKYLHKDDTSALQKGHTLIDKLIDKIVVVKAGYQYQDNKIFFNRSILQYIEDAMGIAVAMEAKFPTEHTASTVLKLMELNKSTALLDGIRESEIKIQNNIPQDLLAFETQKRTELNETKGALFSEENKTTFLETVRDSLVSRQLNLTSILDSVNEIYETQFPKVKALKKIDQSKTLAEYQRNLLPAKTLLIEYFVMDNTLHRMEISTESHQVFRIDNAEKIEDLVREVVDKIKDRKPLSGELSALGRSILPEISEAFENVIIIPDGFLNSLPFEILKQDDSYLIEKCNVSYAGSIQLWEKQIEISKKTKSNDLAGFAPTYLHAALPANVKEVDAIVEKLHGKKFTGKEATKDAFLTHAPTFSMLHIAAHGELNNKNPMLNKLVFTDNNSNNELKALEIYGLNLTAHMVTLSACETGSGKAEIGEGIMSMSRAFTYAGVSSTLVSLWKVPDQQTSQIMISFYDNLEKGQAKNESLRNAKLAYLKSIGDEKLAHPYYWSGFVLTGDISPISKSNKLVWIALGILAIGIFIVFMANNRKKKAA